MAKAKRPGLRKLVAMCPHMRRIQKEYGSPPPRVSEPGFDVLLRIIVDQQVSVHAGAAIWRRLEEGLGKVTPVTVLEAGDGGLRACGFSGAKSRYGTGLAEAIVTGELDLDNMHRKSDEKAQAELVKIKGIGRWTAEIYLMFALGRADLWPAGDLAVAAAAGHLLGLEKRPTPAELDEIGERWRPYRTTAAIMLWHYYRHIKSGFGGMPATKK
ncbi:MAG: DNA-3-methyladenine glycosylase 2 family protein [Rhodospirillales bacterium]|jgi:DNA-3-methyladenine glycosylase II|nr:DNA-3-methyladenine glycosylase 2 family protein [Rhodospirillales bacterium]